MSAPKRFYKNVATRPEKNGYAVLLDGKSMKTPSGTNLIVPTQALAELLAEEWRGQGDTINLPNMRLTRLAQTSLDRVSGQEESVASHILTYAKSDLLCYRAEGPAELAAREAQIWDPLLDWADARFGARLSYGIGLAFVEQSPNAQAAFEQSLRPHDPFRLTALHSAASLLGSLVLTLALEEGHLSPEEAFAASQVDEAYQAEKWGKDKEAIARNDARAKELADIAAFLKTLRSKN